MSTAGNLPLKANSTATRATGDVAGDVASVAEASGNVARNVAGAGGGISKNTLIMIGLGVLVVVAIMAVAGVFTTKPPATPPAAAPAKAPGALQAENQAARPATASAATAATTATIN